MGLVLMWHMAALASILFRIDNDVCFFRVCFFGLFGWLGGI